MGTRSLTHIAEEGETILTLYRQYDGYLEGHGLDLARFLKDISIVNGISSNNTKIANGMGCLSAQLIAHLKDGVGNLYVYPPNSKDCWEEFTYYISDEKLGEEVKIKVEDSRGSTIFNGTPTQLIEKANENN